MKKVLLILSVLFAALAADAQEVKDIKTDLDSVPRVLPPDGGLRGDRSGLNAEPVGFDMAEYGISPDDSLHLPVFNSFGQPYINMYPIDWGGFYDWNLHKGLNVNLGASVSVGFGKGAWKGAGFSQDISAMYAVPVTDKLSFAVGGWFSNMSWARNSFQDAGVSAVLGYKFDEHWEAYIYAQKSIVNKRIPMPLYFLRDTGDRIGAAVKYNFNPNFSIQVSVEKKDYGF